MYTVHRIHVRRVPFRRTHNVPNYYSYSTFYFWLRGALQLNGICCFVPHLSKLRSNSEIDCHLITRAAALLACSKWYNFKRIIEWTLEKDNIVAYRNADISEHFQFYIFVFFSAWQVRNIACALLNRLNVNQSSSAFVSKMFRMIFW